MTIDAAPQLDVARWADGFDQLQQTALGPSVVERVGWVLVHSVWQIALVAALLWLMLRLWREHSATVRYAFSCIALAAALLLPTVTLVWFSASTGIPDGTTSIPIGRGVPSGPNALTGASDPVGAQDAGERAASVVPVSLNSWRLHAVAWIAPHLPAAVVVWCAGVLLCLFRPLAGLYTMRRWRTTGLRAPPECVRAMASRLAGRLRIRIAIDVAVSVWVEVPTVVGYLRPLILLPAATMTSLSPAALEAIIAHELAHVRRHDFLVNLLQTIVESLIFYHPALWWISAQIRCERENCCDDMVLRLCNDRTTYIHALVSLESLRAVTPQPALAATGGPLAARLRRIMALDPAATPRRYPLSALACLSLVSLTAVGALFLTGVIKAPWQSFEPVANAGHPHSSSHATVGHVRPIEAADIAPAGWFRPAPYPEIGYPQPDADYWQFVRLVALPQVQQELGVSDQQRRLLIQAYFDLKQDESELVDNLSAEERRTTAPQRRVEKTALWQAAGLRMEQLLTAKQRKRMAQLIFQRSRHTVFFYPQLAPELEVSDAQRHRLRLLLHEHVDRTDRYQSEHGRTASAVALKQESYRRFWNDAYGILMPEQRLRFEALRGPPVGERRSLHADV